MPIPDQVRAFFSSFSPAPILEFEKLPKSGGDRIYFRITTPDSSYIITYNENVEENNTFFHFTRHFHTFGAPVPHILQKHPNRKIYIQEDFGPVSLLNMLERYGENDYVYGLFQQALKKLAHLQITADEKMDYSWCLTSQDFGKQAILSDLLYFKYYFLDTLKIPYDKEILIEDFEKLSDYLGDAGYKYFMFRDFQSRNICVKDDQLYFIDYQGGMKGALQYDVASLLWQARANLTAEWKDSLLVYYMDCVEEILGSPLDRQQFENQYNGYVLIRMMQVLGAYGFRGLFERKSQFLTSIPLALTNLEWFTANKMIDLPLPEFERVLSLMVDEEIIDRFIPLQAAPDHPLVIKINSFSYKITGYPADESVNGGGFVFDCRGIFNPGRFEEYKQLTGRDKAVIDFLEQRTEMPDFLNGIYNILDITVEDYIRRGFSSLMINFGCTGGRHRSVYAADSLARYLHNKFRVKIEVNHIEQHISEKLGL